jgi:hypothetical protein
LTRNANYWLDKEHIVKQEQSPLTQKNSDEKQAENCLRQLNLPIKSTITTFSCRSVPTALKPSSLHPTTRLACACLAAMLLAAGLESAGAEQWYPPVTYGQGGTNPKVAGGQWGLEVHQGVSAPDVRILLLKFVSCTTMGPTRPLQRPSFQPMNCRLAF